MTKSRKCCHLVWIAIAWIIGALFIYAAVLKIAGPADFARDIKHYKILPLSTVHAVALLLPWWELSAGIALFFRGWRRAGAGIIFLLTVVFSGAVVSAMVRGLDISCGCFGIHSTRVGLKLLTFDLSILLAAGLVFWRSPVSKKPACPAPPPEGE